MEDRFVVLLLLELICSHNAIEGIVADRDGRMCAWCRFYRFSFLHLLAFFLVLVDPKLMGGLVHLQMRDFIMRIVSAHPRSDIREVLGILVEEVLAAFVPLLGFQVCQVLVDFFVGLVQIVASGRRSASVLLLSSDEIQVGILAQTEVQLVALAFLLIDGLVPRIFERMVARRRQSLHYFNVIVHIEPSACDVIADATSVWVLFVLPIGHSLDGILIDLWWLVLSIVPRYVPMRVIGVDDFGVEGDLLEVGHEQFYQSGNKIDKIRQVREQYLKGIWAVFEVLVKNKMRADS